MGAGLNEFIHYLDGRLAVLDVVEKQLCDLQGKYEAYFAEISRIREQEFGQLRRHVENDRDALPGWFDDKLTAAQREVETEYQTKLDALEAEIAEMTERAETLRQHSATAERDAHGRNRTLDEQEEALKARNEHLLTAIANYNEQIRALGGGFGFFANLFRLRKLAKDKARLDEEQADVSARIDALRARWTKEAEGYVQQEHAYRTEWLALETEAAALRTKRDYLVSARARIVARSALERVLYELAKEPARASLDDPPCPRCSMTNHEDNHFCHVCAQRLCSDRPDLEGSIHEMAELNHHFRRFSDGMKSCQEIIGLVRGLSSGVSAFKKSVVDVKRSETTHSLSKLRIEVPHASVAYGQQFDALAQSLRSDWSLHPAVLAERADKLVADVFTEERIKGYFETMGQELSRQADSQW